MPDGSAHNARFVTATESHLKARPADRERQKRRGDVAY